MVLAFDKVVQEVEVPVADGSALLLQDLYNESQTFLALSANMDERVFIVGTGKQFLSGVSSVGITIALSREWLLGFAARAGPAMIACLVNGGNITASHTSTGTATSTGTTILTDTGATFARRGIQTGDVIRNTTDGSAAIVLTVDSETVITHTALTGGGSNDWQVGETWEVDHTHPFFPTAFTHVGFAQDAAAVAIDASTLVADEVHWIQAFAEGTATLQYAVWLERNGSVVTSGLVSATINWRNAVDGTLLFTNTDVSPDAQGVFHVSLSQALIDDTTYYVDLIVTDGTGTVETRRGIGTAGT